MHEKDYFIRSNPHHKKAQKANLHLEQRKESCKFVAELRTRTDLTACNLKKKC